MANPKSGALSDEAGFKRLVVLESEYRTQRPADQLHAIASFPQLFEEFPNPVIINSAFLKLADYFRNTNNVQRHAILQVFKKSEAHLNLILNVEETIKRISPMLQSNDPLGRAITLSVIHCLDSTEAMEVSAAIYVADRICAHSQKFCAIISGKLAFMIRDPKVALPFKRRMIRIFGHMFEDITLARLIELLLQMAWNQGAGIRRVALMCLGSLASQTIEFEPSQVKTLFEIASKSKDEKTSVRAMGVLARLFQSTFLVSGLILEDGGEQTLIEFLQKAVNLLSQEGENVAASSAAIEETFKLVCTMLECYRSVVDDGSTDLVRLSSVFEASLQSMVTRLRDYLSLLWGLKQPPLCLGNEDQRHLLRRHLNMYITLSLWQNNLVPPLLRQFANWIESFPQHHRILLEAYHRVAQQRPLDVQMDQEVLFLYLAQKHSYSTDTTSENFVLACKAILTAKTVRTSQDPEPFVRKITEHLHRFGGWNSMTEQYTTHHWALYQIGRVALRTGWPELAQVALHSLAVDVETVPCRQWIGALQELAQAEAFLNSRGGGGGSAGNGSALLDLSTPLQLYARAIGRLEEMEVYPAPPRNRGSGDGDSSSSSGSGNGNGSGSHSSGRGAMDRAFQLQYCHLRSRFLQACRRALILLEQGVLMTIRGATEATASTTAEESAAAASTGPLLLQCASSLNEMAHQYTLMRLQVAHHAASESALEVLQTACLCLAFAIQRVARSTMHRVATATSRKQQQQDAMVVDSQVGQPSLAGGQSGGSAGKGKRVVVAENNSVFDIDPLLIPLLYVESTESGQQGGGAAMSSRDLFQASMRRLLRYVVEMTGEEEEEEEEEEEGDVEDAKGSRERAARRLTRRYAVARQVILRLVSMPTPFPARFFNHV
ncbi:Integrator complex subunit 7 [Actinomortierella ambigua]|nr:Integrator complex subunit 7 [Actinomortierella ambigua]